MRAAGVQGKLALLRCRKRPRRLHRVRISQRRIIQPRRVLLRLHERGNAARLLIRKIVASGADAEDHELRLPVQWEELAKVDLAADFGPDWQLRLAAVEDHAAI